MRSKVARYLRLLSFEDVYGHLSKADKLRLLRLALVDLDLELERMALTFGNERYGL